MQLVKGTLAALGLAVAVTPAVAEVNANNLVNVNISDIVVDLQDLVDVTITDNVVQVPIGVAAAVCDVNANLLAEQARNGGAVCTASNTSQALVRAVERANG